MHSFNQTTFGTGSLAVLRLIVKSVNLFSFIVAPAFARCDIVFGFLSVYHAYQPYVKAIFFLHQ